MPNPGFSEDLLFEAVAALQRYGSKREAAKAIEYLDATGIHSCSPYCDNWACLLRRENAALKVDLGRVRELLRLTWMYACSANEDFAEQVLDELDKQAKDKKRKRVRKP